MNPAAIWLYIFLNPWGEIEISNPSKAAFCTEQVRDGAEWTRGDKAECVHALEPWRRITANGPNKHELRARARESDPEWLMEQQRKQDEAQAKAGKALAKERVDQLEWEAQMMSVSISDRDDTIKLLCAALEKVQAVYCGPVNTEVPK